MLETLSLQLCQLCLMHWGGGSALSLVNPPNPPSPPGPPASASLLWLPGCDTADSISEGGVRAGTSSLMFFSCFKILNFYLSHLFMGRIAALGKSG